MVDAIVEHDYIAKEPDELSIKKGDVIKDVVKKQKGWSEGTLNDKKGAFPDNFVKLIDKEVTMRNSNDVSRIRKCRVIFSYKQAHEDELNLNVDDVIEIIGEEEVGWWKGVVNGKQGVFPSNFVEEINQSSSKPNSIEDLTNISDSEHSSPSLPPKPTKVLCEVKYAYKAQNDDELTLKEGDLVTLISKDGQDAGWWRGELSGKIGVFPDNFVVIIEERSNDKKSSSQEPKNYVNKYIASQRKSFDPPKPDARIDPELSRAIPPIVPSKKPSIPIKKSPSGGSGGLFSGLKKKIVDAVDGAGASKGGGKTQTELKTDNKTEESHENAFDQVERNSLLPDVRATRAKAPGRRPPSVVYKEGEQNVINGNSDYGSLEENLSLSNNSIEQELCEAKPKVREWEKHKAPWLEEMKLNQAKRTSTSPGPETRNKLTTPDKALSDVDDAKTPIEKESSPVDMSKSMPSFNTKKTPEPEKPTKILKTPPNELEKGVILRNKPVVNSRPQTIETAKPTNISKISPIIQPTKTPSPVQKPQIVEKPVLIEAKTNHYEPMSMKQYNDMLDRLHKLESLVEKQHIAIEDLKGKLQVETDMRMMLQVEVEKVSQCVMQV